MTELVLTNANIVLRGETVTGDIRIVDGRIADIGSGASAVPGAVDCEGDTLLPGLVELHTDALERHFMPRPGVEWPGVAAALAHDAQITASGITTVFDALSIGDAFPGTTRTEKLDAMTGAVRSAQAAGLLRAEHLLHLRCEVSYSGVLDRFATLLDEPALRLVSLMDHTPGQRQFVSLDAYRTYYMGKYGLTETQMEQQIARQREAQATFSARHRDALAEICRERGLTLASHDDATEAHVAESLGHGAAIAEFPTTEAAARAAHDSGLKVLMGAPNLVLGGSHSGNASTLDFAAAGLLDVLSSDYVPTSLLHGVFLLAESGLALPDAVATASANPAAAVGLDDRGEIAIGRRADLVRVARRGAVPVARTVWRAGARVM